LDHSHSIAVSQKNNERNYFMLEFRYEVTFFKQYKCGQKLFFSIASILLSKSIAKSSNFRGH